MQSIYGGKQMSREIPEFIKEALKQAREKRPDLIEKFGDPEDENDPRFWAPSERKERGVSLEDRITYLELDMEATLKATGPTIMWVMEKQREEELAKLKEDPAAYIQNMIANGADPVELVKGLLELRASIAGDGQITDDNGNTFAGSSQGLAPDTVVDTVNGQIRADQIPGYRNSPDWRPSIDWVDANCTCEEHKRMRAAASSGEADGGFSTGMYL
jgi:hypothetical protein